MDIAMMTSAHKQRESMVFWIPIIVFCLFKLSYLTYTVRFFRYFYLACECMVIVFSFLCYFLYKEIDMIDIGIVLFIAILSLSTLYNHGDYQALVQCIEQVLFIYTGCRWGFNLNPSQFIRQAARYSLLVTLLNTTMEIIMYPKALFYYTNGVMSGAFLLGGDNTSTRLYIVSIMFCGLWSIQSGKRYVLPISIVNFIVASFVRDIGNGKVCSVVLLVGYLLFEIIKIKAPREFALKGLVGNAILTILLVVYNRVDLFSYIIEEILKRDLTLTTRTTIWRITLERIYHHPFIGNGYFSGERFESLLPSIMGVNPHNTFLTILFMGGIILFSVVMFLFLCSIERFDSDRNAKKFWIIPVTLMALLLRSQVEGGDVQYFILFVAVMYSTHYLDEIIDVEHCELITSDSSYSEVSIAG